MVLEELEHLVEQVVQEGQEEVLVLQEQLDLVGLVDQEDQAAPEAAEAAVRPLRTEVRAAVEQDHLADRAAAPELIIILTGSMFHNMFMVIVRHLHMIIKCTHLFILPAQALVVPLPAVLQVVAAATEEH